MSTGDAQTRLPATDNDGNYATKITSQFNASIIDKPITVLRFRSCRLTTTDSDTAPNMNIIIEAWETGTMSPGHHISISFRQTLLVQPIRYMLCK